MTGQTLDVNQGNEIANNVGAELAATSQLRATDLGDAAADGSLDQFISFRVGTSEYAVGIMQVREIKGYSEVTRLPNTPEYVRGVLNLRGVIVPIFDLRCRFGMGATEASSLHVIIIVAVQERLIGILVDAVSDILSASANQVMPVPDIDARQDQDFLEGLVTVDDRMVALLALERLFEFAPSPEDLGAASE